MRVGVVDKEDVTFSGEEEGKGKKTYAIESDTFQSDFPHQFRRLYRISLRRSGLVQLR